MKKIFHGKVRKKFMKNKTKINFFLKETYKMFFFFQISFNRSEKYSFMKKPNKKSFFLEKN